MVGAEGRGVCACHEKTRSSCLSPLHLWSGVENKVEGAQARGLDSRAGLPQSFPTSNFVCSIVGDET